MLSAEMSILTENCNSLAATPLAALSFQSPSLFAAGHLLAVEVFLVDAEQDVIAFVVDAAGHPLNLALPKCSGVTASREDSITLGTVGYKTSPPPRCANQSPSAFQPDAAATLPFWPGRRPLAARAGV